ncbi:Hypothetical predicted protein, partial [Scomber scombrus]
VYPRRVATKCAVLWVDAWISLAGQTNDDHYKNNSQTTQDQTRQLCYSIRLFYKKDQ